MKLFEPGRIGSLTVKNRIVLAPMGIGGASDEDGSWGEGVREYYAARARGGTGLITTMLVFVTRQFEPTSRRYFDLYDERHLESLRRVAESCHSYGAKLSVQLTAGFGRVLSVPQQDRVLPPVSASENPCHFNPERTTRALITEEAATLTASFGLAAGRCQAAGADAVELHGHEGYLMDQFMTALWNRRTDRYGGSPEKRLTFARECIGAIRAATGPSFPVIYRYGLDHHLKGGRTVAESLLIARELEAMGVDALHVDAGCYETHEWPHPTTYQAPGFMVDMAEAVKPEVKIPVITVGKMNYPEVAERALQEGKADFVAIGRGLLADPEWPNKVRKGLVPEIRPCIGDNMGCLGELIRRRPTSCTVNPLCGYELAYALKPAGTRGAVLVVGGGPAGMEAARVAALRGLRVMLWERRGALGGNLVPAAAPEFKKDLRLLVDYQVRQVRGLPGIEISLSREATAASVAAAGADYVIVATGATLAPPEVPGLAERSTDAIAVLNGRAKPGKRVLVVGGGLIGGETAVFLAHRGHQVVLASRRAVATSDAYPVNRDVLASMMKESRVAVRTSCNLVRGIPGGVVLNCAGVEQELPVDTVVFCRDMRPDNQLARALEGKVAWLQAIGDCVEPRTVKEAIWEAFHAARKIEA